MVFKPYIEPSNMEEFIKVPKFNLRTMGVWPIAKSKWSWIYYLHSLIIAYSVSLLFLLSLTIDIYLSLGDLSVVVDASYFFMTELTFIIKFLLFTSKRSKFIKLLEDTENPIFILHRPEQTVFLKSWSRFATVYSQVFFASCHSCTLFYGIFPLIDKDGDNILPFRGWFPFDVKNNYQNRACVYAFQILGLAVAISVNASLDVLPTIFMNIGCAQIEILKDNLETATKRAEILEKEGTLIEDTGFMVKIKQTFGENYFEPLSEEADNIVHSILCRCIEHQKAILKLLADVEALFSVGMFFQFITTCVTVCITGFQLMVIPFQNLKIVAVVCYFIAVLIQISLYCWNGHQVIVQSSGIGESCYNMDWYRCSIKVKKTIFIIMERCKIPIHMTAGNFFVLSIETLTMVIRTAYSYFAVLRRMYNE